MRLCGQSAGTAESTTHDELSLRDPGSCEEFFSGNATPFVVWTQHRGELGKMRTVIRGFF